MTKAAGRGAQACTGALQHVHMALVGFLPDVLAAHAGTRQEAVLEACLGRFYSRDADAQEGMVVYRRSKEQVP